MKIYSGNKVRLFWTLFELSKGGKSWIKYLTITKPMKGGHTHNHLRNALAKSFKKDIKSDPICSRRDKEE